MSVTLRQPLEYPAALLTKRVRPPEFLYIAVDDLSGSGLAASQDFSYDEFTKRGIEAHLSHKTPTPAKSSFISAYEKEEVALRYSALPSPWKGKGKGKARSGKAIKVTIDMGGLVPGWMTVSTGIQIPVWVEEGPRPAKAGFEIMLWMCLEEVKVVLGLKESDGERGEWLACGYVPQERIVAHVALPGVKPVDRVIYDDEKEEADKLAKKDRRRLVRKKARAKEDAKAKEKGKAKIDEADARSIQPPQIPVRKSSLRSTMLHISQQDTLTKLKMTTRDATLSLTNPDPHRASSLFKYALLVAHEKRLTAEEAWLLQTGASSMPSRPPSSRRSIDNGDNGSVQDSMDIESAGRRLRRGGRRHHVPDLDTIPEDPRLTRYSSGHEPQQHGSFEQRGESSTGRRERSGARREPTSQTDNHMVPADAPRTGRSAEPPSPQTPSRLQNQTHGKSKEASERSTIRRPRREILEELQSDEDSVLREYARVCLGEEEEKEEQPSPPPSAPTETSQNSSNIRPSRSRRSTPRIDLCSSFSSSFSSSSPPSSSLDSIIEDYTHIDVSDSAEEEDIKVQKYTSRIPRAPITPQSLRERASSRGEGFRAKGKAWREERLEQQARIASLSIERQRQGQEMEGKRDGDSDRDRDRDRDVWSDAGR
ncbi:hypothetical protein EJ02DRAFT_178306 [Clathrospora elynae]|uniref:Uncharacterized protein n=1 Tax=Clathrospora elynae TaxID=706981 RepID=A0A6A5SNM8_9PLEO|nr:hypothetical protein EJ02DRAFT_178306 [Clathrospora elynae]